MGGKQSLSKIGSLLLLGAAIGYAASLFLPAPERIRQKKLLKKNAKTLQKLLTDENQRERIEEIFEKSTSQAVEKYTQAKDILVRKLSELKLSVHKIDKAKYIELLGEIGEELRDKQSLSTNQVKKLLKLWKNDYEKIKNHFSN